MAAYAKFIAINILHINDESTKQFIDRFCNHKDCLGSRKRHILRVILASKLTLRPHPFILDSLGYMPSAGFQNFLWWQLRSAYAYEIHFFCKITLDNIAFIDKMT